MRSETPKDRVPSAFDDAASSYQDREQRDSMAMDLLDTAGGDGSSDSLGFDSGSDGGTMLLPHERKLPLSEQRRIIAGRKQHDDGIDEDDSQAMGGRRGRGRRRQNADQPHERGPRHGHGGSRRTEAEHAEGHAPVRADGDAEAGKASGGGSARGPAEKIEDAGAATGSGSGGGSRIERESLTPEGATRIEPRTIEPGTPAIATRGDAVRLDDPAHPHAPLYGAALRAVTELTPAQASMTPAEQANVAAALTARMTGDATFAQQLGDPSRLSFGLGQNGDRLFAINHPIPDAPNAVHVSVNLEQARTLPIDASSGHVDIAATTRDQAQIHAIEPRAIDSHGSIDSHAVESPAREHPVRQA